MQHQPEAETTADRQFERLEEDSWMGKDQGKVGKARFFAEELQLGAWTHATNRRHNANDKNKSDDQHKLYENSQPARPQHHN